jgi:hypothetical protein
MSESVTGMSGIQWGEKRMQAHCDIRVSADGQTPGGVSLAAQEARLRAHCSAAEERDGRL